MRQRNQHLVQIPTDMIFSSQPLVISCRSLPLSKIVTTIATTTTTMMMMLIVHIICPFDESIIVPVVTVNAYSIHIHHPIITNNRSIPSQQGHNIYRCRNSHSQRLQGLFAAPKNRSSNNNSSSGKGNKITGTTGSKKSCTKPTASSTSGPNHNRSKSKKKTKSSSSVSTPPRANTMRYQSGGIDEMSIAMGGGDPPKTLASRKTATASTGKSMPPWSVRSPKDALQHVELEKVRRATIQQQQQQLQQNAVGQSTPLSSTTTTNATVNSIPLLLSKAFLSNKEQQFIKWKRFKTSDTVAGQRLVHTFFNQTTMQRQILPNYGVPEIAFIGRSNVGKSSLLNKLSSSTTTKKSTFSASSSSSPSSFTTTTTMARVGKTPGATASVNMYSLYDRKQKDLIVFTDLPGFGYAKLSKERQEAIIRTTEQYIYQRSTVTKTLALGILLLDIRRTPSQDDIELLETLYDMNVPILVVVTKCDKVSSKYEREQLLNNIQNELQLPQLPFTISSMTGENINLLWQIIFDACDTCVQQMKQIYEAIDTTEEEEDDEEADYYQDDENEIIIAANDSYDSWYDEQDETVTSDIDDDDIEYDQGFDWDNDNIMLEYDDGYNRNENSNRLSDDALYMDGNDNDEDENGDFGMSSEPTPTKRVTLKSLKRRVKKMQRRGEI